MSFGFEHEPRWVLDTSSVFDGWCDDYLRDIVSNMPSMLELHPDYCEGKQYVDKFDRPFIFLPPCWSELQVALEALTRMEDPWVNEIEKASLLLKELVKANVMTDDWGDSRETLEERRAERKLWWLKFVSDHLETIGKEVVFISENPMLLLRASIAGISSCSAKEKLFGNGPRGPVESWTGDYQTDEKVLFVDKKYFAFNEGASLNTQLFFSAESESFRIFLTKDVQEFAQEYQVDQISLPHYPFSLSAPEHADINRNPDHNVSAECHLAKNGCKVVEHVVEYESVLANSVNFEKDYFWWIIGEPFGAETGDGICLDQVLETSRLFIISDDQEWAKNTRSKILGIRPRSAPEILDMKAAFGKFGWKRTIGDAAKDEDAGGEALEAPSTSDTSSSSIGTDSSGQSSMLEGDSNQMEFHCGLPLVPTV